ncbi:hypothetical protein BMS3Abin17_00243 [archaeon BMS3Abin17]|nr:hypothetical protein BMS3Abin17_00243 [archaeon BMS3Abin17]HDZ61206.1 hypothetical protein [Candidatus Pacearchaeota archaeon]
MEGLLEDLKEDPFKISFIDEALEEDSGISTEQLQTALRKGLEKEVSYYEMRVDLATLRSSKFKSYYEFELEKRRKFLNILERDGVLNYLKDI